MIGRYIPFNDGCGIVGYGYLCPECEWHTLFTACDVGCEKCGYFEPYVDPDEWYDELFSRKDEA